MAALFSLSTCIFSFYISLDVFAQGSARCASTRASPESQQSILADANHIFVVGLQAFDLSGGFLRGTPLSEDAPVPQTCGP